MAEYSEMAAAESGAEMPAGGDLKPKSQLVCPNCGATFEQVEKPAEGGEGAGEAGGEDKSWEEDLRHMAARTPEAEGQPQ
jgi:hypothetical protein